MDALLIAKYVGITAGVIASAPVIKAALAISRESGRVGQLLADTAQGVTDLRSELSKAAERNFEASRETANEIKTLSTTNASEHSDLFRRSDESRVALVGIDGKNGIRGTVERAATKAEEAARKADEVARVLVEANQKQHNRLADWSPWREGVDTRLDDHGTRIKTVEERVVEKRKAKKPRRKTARTGGRRKGEK